MIGHLSHGYRQRVGVAQAIIHNPTLLILDEPTRGLDPVQIVEMRTMIHDLKEQHTVLISSHILTEISQTCDRLLVLGRGTLLAAGTEKELTADLAEIKGVSVAVKPKGEAAGGDNDAGDDEVKDLLAKVEGVDEVTTADALAGSLYKDARLYKIACSRDVRAEVGRAVVGAGHDLLKLDHAHSELESTFLKLVQGGTDASN
jgi:ABC-2 type transport system ATP-binding protein